MVSNFTSIPKKQKSSNLLRSFWRTRYWNFWNHIEAKCHSKAKSSSKFGESSYNQHSSFFPNIFSLSFFLSPFLFLSRLFLFQSFSINLTNHTCFSILFPDLFYGLTISKKSLIYLMRLFWFFLNTVLVVHTNPNHIFCPKIQL